MLLAVALATAVLVLGPVSSDAAASATAVAPLWASSDSVPVGFDIDAPFTVVGDPIIEDPHIDTDDGQPLTDAEIEEILEITNEPAVADLPPGMAFATTDQVYSWTAPGQIDVTLTAKSYVPDAAIDIVHQTFVEFREFIDLDLTSSASHKIEISWVSLPASTLASASTTYVIADQDGQSFLIPLLLADTLADTNHSSAASMRVFINADMDWDLTLNPTDQAIARHYLKSVMLHEVGHGLGFTAALSSPADADTAKMTPWSEQLYIGQNLSTPWSTLRSTGVQTNDVWFLNNDGTWERVYDPLSWQSGSSFSHLNEATYRPHFGAPSDPGTLMTPASGIGEISHVDGVIAGVLSRLGYQTFASPAAPIISASYQNQQTVVAVSPGHDSAANVPAKLWIAELRTDAGALLQTMTVDATSRSITLPGELAPGDYQLRVTANVDGNTTTSELDFSTSSSSGTTTSSSLPPTTPSTTSPPTSQPTTTAPPATQPTTTTTSAPPFYANCDQVRAANQAPILSSNPSFRSAFDPDHDGIGCERSITVGTNEPALSTDSPQIWYRFQIARLYSAYFGRYPEQGGWEYWNTRFVADAPLADMSQFFSQSDEFQALYGDSLTNTEFVALVYQNVLLREGEPGGMAYWSSELDHGLNRGEMMIGFSESIEFIFNSGPTSTNTCWQATDIEDTIGIRKSYACAAGETPNPN